MIFTSEDEIVLMSKKENIEGQEYRKVCQLVRKIDNEATEKLTNYVTGKGELNEVVLIGLRFKRSPEEMRQYYAEQNLIELTIDQAKLLTTIGNLIAMRAMSVGLNPTK
jgi:patatin-like phospholipase/acyl hydrolase